MKNAPQQNAAPGPGNTTMHAQDVGSSVGTDQYRWKSAAQHEHNKLREVTWTDGGATYWLQLQPPRPRGRGRTTLDRDAPQAQHRSRRSQPQREVEHSKCVSLGVCIDHNRVNPPLTELDELTATARSTQGWMHDSADD